MAFSEKLSHLMEKNSVSNYRLAKEIGVSQSSVANWRCGVKPIQICVEKVADYFGVTVDYLLEEGKE